MNWYMVGNSFFTGTYFSDGIDMISCSTAVGYSLMWFKGIGGNKR